MFPLAVNFRLSFNWLIFRLSRYGADEVSLRAMTPVPVGGFKCGCPAINIMRAYEKTHSCSDWLARFAQVTNASQSISQFHYLFQTM